MTSGDPSLPPNEVRRLQYDPRDLIDQRLGLLGLMAGGVAHDMCNILQIISGNLELLKTDPALDCGAQIRLASALNGVALGADLTSRLLAHCRAEPCLCEVVDLGEPGLQRSLRTMVADAVGEDISLEFEVADGIWPVAFSLAQFKAALLNLAVNARDAMGGRGLVYISLQNVVAHAADGLDAVRVTIADTGPGIPDEILDKMFLPFFTTRAANGGTGLGLALVRHFADTAGATLEVDSTKNIGTSFRLAFPRYP